MAAVAVAVVAAVAWEAVPGTGEPSGAGAKLPPSWLIIRQVKWCVMVCKWPC